MATLYLDAADAQAEDVSERLLRRKLRRMLDVVNAIMDLESEDRPPVHGSPRDLPWCSLAASFGDGQTFLTAGLN